MDGPTGSRDNSAPAGTVFKGTDTGSLQVYVTTLREHRQKPHEVRLGVIFSEWARDGGWTNHLGPGTHEEGTLGRVASHVTETPRTLRPLWTTGRGEDTEENADGG